MLNHRSDHPSTADHIDAIADDLTGILAGIDAELTSITNQMRDSGAKADYLELAKTQNDWRALRTRVYRIGMTASEFARKARKR